MTLYLKWTSTGRTPSYQGGRPIPYRKWTPTVPNPRICQQGWHACRWEDTIHHIATELWIVELDGNIATGSDKVAAERLRIVRKVPGINERTLRLFAADCADRVLPIYSEQYPGDDRPAIAIECARRFAKGEASPADLAAAGAAAWAAAGATAGAAGAAWDAAGAAARAAAGAARAADAARAAAWDAAGDAAWAAAWATAGATAGAAGAAWDAAWATAGDARAAARDAQTQDLLVKYGSLDPHDFTHNSTTLETS